jgi:uncharacterized phiE125 gp8 family phage protein
VALCEIATSWAVTTAPAEEPVSIEEAKLYVGITDVDSDALVEGWIRTARHAAEDYLGRGLFTQTRKFFLSDFANVMPLPMAAPLAEVTSVKYYDADGAFQTLSTDVYAADTEARPGAVVLKPDQTWPSLHSTRLQWRVEITYVVGWTSRALIPDRIKQGILIYVKGLDLERSQPGAALAAEQQAARCWDDRISWTAPHW